MKFRLLSLSLTAFIFTGCWNKNFQEPGRIEVERKPTERVVSSSFARVWAAAQVTMAKFPIVKKDADVNGQRAYVVSDWVKGKSDILYHGYDVTRVPYTIRYKLYLYLSGDHAGHTKINIKSSEEYLDDVVTAGVDFEGSVQTWIRTDSSTLKENSLIQNIEKLAQDPKFKADSVN